MEKNRGEKRAFEHIMGAVIQHGIDRIVEDPGGVMERAMGVSRKTAVTYLKKWQQNGFIMRYQDTQTGFITHVRILTDKLPEQLHEQSEEQRLIKALWKCRRPSKGHPGSFIVHATLFPDVKRIADIDDKRFYIHLPRLSESGLIKPVSYPAGNKRYLYVILTSQFPEM